jgi:hypothetical protein
VPVSSTDSEAVVWLDVPSEEGNSTTAMRPLSDNSGKYRIKSYVLSSVALGTVKLAFHVVPADESLSREKYRFTLSWPGSPDVIESTPVAVRSVKNAVVSSRLAE